jgi:hypothetical protein
VGPGAGLGRCGKSRPTGIRSPDLPVRSESLYRLRYPGSLQLLYSKENNADTTLGGPRSPSPRDGEEKVLDLYRESNPQSRNP